MFCEKRKGTGERFEPCLTPLGPLSVVLKTLLHLVVNI